MVDTLSIVSTVDPDPRIMAYFVVCVARYAAGSAHRVQWVVVEDGRGGSEAPWRSAAAAAGIDFHPLDTGRVVGQMGAMLSGLAVASGEAVLTIDPDMAANLDDVPRFLDCLTRGMDVVYGRRLGRAGTTTGRYLLSRAYAGVMSMISSPRIRDINTPMVLLSRRALDTLRRAPRDVGSLKLYLPHCFPATFAEVDILRMPPVVSKRSAYGMRAILALFVAQVREVIQFIIQVRCKQNGV